MNPIKWLEINIPEFVNLPEADRQAIFHFSLLWSLFEAKALETSASANSIVSLVNKWNKDGNLESKAFENDLEYFRQRYFVEGEPTHYFEGLHLRKNDRPELIRGVLRRENDNAVDCITALIIVVYRLRNNLFHGVKWAYGIRGQLDNFTHANEVIMNALSLTDTH
jgi:hypothetical protein